MIPWNNPLLEPVLITFNRAKYVEATLQAFLNAGLTSMRLHVLDNCSTDNTKNIVKKFQQNWPNLQYHCNPYNIGGNGNILRAVEMSDSEYHWVIGDDDEWYLENIEELIQVLEKKEADIIRLGWLVSAMSRGKLHLSNALIEKEQLFFGSTSMISATILRRSLATKYLRQAYSNISNFYPQLIPIILSAQKKNMFVYTLKQDLMHHTPSPEPGTLIGDLEWYAVWYKTGLFFNDQKWRRRFNQETLHYIKMRMRQKLPCWLFFVRQALHFKSFGFQQGRYFFEIFIYGIGIRKNFLLAAMSYFLIPKFFAKGLREVYRRLYKLPKKTIMRDESR